MIQITANNPVHFRQCGICGEKIKQPDFNVWANVPENQVDFVVTDNERMQKENWEQWQQMVDTFDNQHEWCKV